MKTKLILYVLAGLVALASLVACKTISDDPVVQGHKEIAENVGDWGSKFAEGWSRDEKPEDPAPEPTGCEWIDFGPCDEPPPIEWFGITDDNQNGINDADE